MDNEAFAQLPQGSVVVVTSSPLVTEALPGTLWSAQMTVGTLLTLTKTPQVEAAHAARSAREVVGNRLRFITASMVEHVPE